MRTTTATALSLAELTARFDALRVAIGRFFDECPPGRWHATTKEEGWPAGVTLHHIGAIHYPVIAQVQAMIDGTPLTVTTTADVDRLNEAHVRDHADCTPAETQAFLHAEGERVRDWLGTLTEADLQREAVIPFMGGRTTAGRLLKVVLLDLADGHLTSARRAAGLDGNVSP